MREGQVHPNLTNSSSIKKYVFFLMAIHCFLTWSASQTILPIASARYITIHVTATCHRGTPPSFCQDMQQTRPRSLNRCFNTEEEIASVAAESHRLSSAHTHAHARCKGIGLLPFAASNIISIGMWDLRLTGRITEKRFAIRACTDQGSVVSPPSAVAETGQTSECNHRRGTARRRPPTQPSALTWTLFWNPRSWVLWV